MWGYQEHFRFHVEYVAREALKLLGVSVELKALLVGARRAGSSNRNPVCVEPEDGEWPPVLFNGLLESVEAIYSEHPLQNMFFGDEPSNRDKPEVMRMDSVSTAVKRSLLPYDSQHDVRSFVGGAWPVGDFYVVPVIQAPESLFKKFPPLKERPQKDEFRSNGYPSFIHAVLATVLDEATTELQGADPGRSQLGKTRRADEIVRLAAESFMHTPGLAITEHYTYAGLFARLNLISSLLYEGTRGIGRLILADPSNPSIEHLLSFRTPVQLHDSRWTRKVLELAGPHGALIADSQCVYGLGRLSTSYSTDDQSVFVVDFLDHYSWDLRCGGLVLLRSLYGEPTLPNEVINEDDFTSNLERLFPTSTGAERMHIWHLFNTATRQEVGSMIVVAEDAEFEAERLASQGTSIEPVEMSVDLLQQVSAIDGSILLDPHGRCHAIGVILDGLANDQCTPSRGSRYNSAVRYVRSGAARRLAVVVSDDRTVDVFPRLRPRQSRRELADHISVFIASTADNYHSSMNWLDARRFYLDAQQCAQVNAALVRLDALPLETGEIRFLISPFKVNPEFNESYLVE
jgi:hypothetical protein